MIAKSKLASTEIENELKEIEREWKARAEVIAQKKLADQLPLKEPQIVEKVEKYETVQVSNFKSEFKAENKENSIEQERDWVGLEKILGAEQIKNLAQNQVKLIEKVFNAIFVSLTKESRRFWVKFGDGDVKKEEIDVELGKMSISEKKEDKKPVELSEMIKDPVLESKLRNFFNPQQWRKEFEDEKKVRFEGVDEVPENGKEDEVVVYPLVDEYCQLQIRQQLFCEKVCKNMDAIFRKSASEVGLRIMEMKKEMKPFAKSMNLSNKSFNFKPEEWILVAIFMLNLLCVEDKQLNECIWTDKYYLALVNSFGLSCEKLQQILQFMILK